MKSSAPMVVASALIVAACTGPSRDGLHSESPATADDRASSVGVGSSGVGSSGVGGAGNAQDLPEVRAMLVDVEQHGWNSCTKGLAINWAPVAGRTDVDWNDTGHPDPSGCTRHEDRMTTLRILHALLLYRQDSGSSEFDTMIATYHAHVLALFTAEPTDARGWAWDELTDVAHLSGDPRFDAIATTMLQHWDKKLADSSRPDYQFEEAAALVESGQPAYVSKGNAVLAALWAHDFDAKLGLISQPQIKTSVEGDIAVALARAGKTTQAKDIQTGLQALWDPTYGGYAESAILDHGTPRINWNKTGGRMMNMLTLADITNDTTQQHRLLTTFNDHIYRATPTGYEGVLYEQARNWAPVTKTKVTQTWVTAEAIAITCVTLLQTP